MPEKPPIGVIGVGWVGLVTAACFAELGHDVWCRDIDAAKIDVAARGQRADLRAGPRRSWSRATPSACTSSSSSAPVLEHARLLFVCVDTPPTYSGDADLSRVEAVIEELPASSEHAIVMKSTVPVGTGANVRRRLGELGKGELGYASNPEFLKEGSAVEDFMHPDRVVVGADARTPWAADAVARLYEPLDCPVVRTDVASAEMIKLASNAFLATKISFINEIANVCEEVGADVARGRAGMGLDPRIGGSFLNAGHRLRRFLLPEGRLRPEAARRQLRLPLPAPDRRDRGERAAEAARRQQAEEAPRLARRQADRAARPRLQAEHRRHARGLERRARRAPAGRGRDRARLRPGRRGARRAR